MSVVLNSYTTVCLPVRSIIHSLKLESGRAAYTAKKFHRIYGRIAGTQLPVQVPLFLRKPVKIIWHDKTG